MQCNLPLSLISAATLLLVIASDGVCLADGQGVLVQAHGDRLVVGAGDDSANGQEIGQRVFGDRLSSNGIGDDPSFFSLSTPPVGLDALPAGASIEWDFLPVTIDDVTSNLFHWDATGAVDFAPTTTDNLSLFDVTNTSPATVDGSAAAVPGERIGTVTNDFLSLHAHRFWFLQGNQGDPTSGIYLTAMRLRVDGYVPSEPFFVALATSDTSATSLSNDALPWIEANIDDLIREGDYNYDGVVDTADYQLWRTQFGATTPQAVDVGEADGNGDGLVDAADYTVWRDQYLATSSAARAVASPEPASMAVAFLTLGIISTGRRTWAAQR